MDALAILPPNSIGDGLLCGVSSFRYLELLRVPVHCTGTNTGQTVILQCTGCHEGAKMPS